MPTETVELGRAAYRDNRWNDAYDHLKTASQDASLSIEDLQRLAMAALMTNRIEEGQSLREQAHEAQLDAGDGEQAARTAMWIAFTYFQNGEVARAGGWMAKAHRLINEPYRDCVEQGYLLIPQGLQAFSAGQFEAGYELFAKAEAIGERFDDRELVVLVRHGRGRCLIGMGKVEEGLGLLDEAMLEVMNRTISPLVVGTVYCSVIDACRSVFDFRRAQEWTAALDRWSEAQPESAQFRGQCLVFRAEFKAMHGDWTAALEEASVAAARLSEPPPHVAAGAAHYQQAEIYRLKGDLDAAEISYIKASELGESPHPGLALLRLAQGRRDSALAAIERELDAASALSRRCQLLLPYIEITLMTGDVESARSAAGELTDFAKNTSAPFVQALADLATGWVMVEEGSARESLPYLNAAQLRWRELDCPYDLARTSVLIGIACKSLGDEDTCQLEINAARKIFERLGAQPAQARLDAISSGASASAGLTGREVEVLALIATGKTNREIAGHLVISEKTVARHIANIFVKLGLSSRAAATAYAVKNGLA